MLNRVVLVGRLVKDPEMKYTQSGVAVTTITLAVNRPFKNQSGENEADFIRCIVWRKQAENVANYLSKGSLAGVDGRIQTRNYDDRDGKRVFMTEVVAESVQFLESKKSTNEGTYEGNYNKTNDQNYKGNQNDDPFTGGGNKPIDINDDDLPF